MIIFTALSVELSLTWNEVTGIYVLGSTSQLIPFIVGLLGFLRNVHLIVVQFAERIGKRQERKIRVDFSSGTYFYDVGKRGKLELDVATPKRRWSIDQATIPTRHDSMLT